MWNYDDPCNTFPTLYFDVNVHAFFVVPRRLPSQRAINNEARAQPQKGNLYL